MKITNKQNGSTLLVGMIMLILLTLIALSAIESTTSSLQMVGNAQFREEATAAAQQAVENVISNTNFTTSTPAIQNIDINNDTVADYKVTFSPPVCSKYSAIEPATEKDIPLKCYGSSPQVYCYRTVWDVSAIVEDISPGTTGAKVQLHQGIKILVGLNAALASCGV